MQYHAVISETTDDWEVYETEGLSINRKIATFHQKTPKHSFNGISTAETDAKRYARIRNTWEAQITRNLSVLNDEVKGKKR